MIYENVTSSLSSSSDYPQATFYLVGILISRPASLGNSETASGVPTSSKHSINMLILPPCLQNFPQEQTKDTGGHSLKDLIVVPLQTESPIILKF